MTRYLLVGGAAVLISLGGLNAQDKPAVSGAADIEVRKVSITNLEAHTVLSVQHLAEWGKDIVDLDGRKEWLEKNVPVKSGEK